MFFHGVVSLEHNILLSVSRERERDEPSSATSKVRMTQQRRYNFSSTLFLRWLNPKTILLMLLLLVLLLVASLQFPEVHCSFLPTKSFRLTVKSTTSSSCTTAPTTAEMAAQQQQKQQPTTIISSSDWEPLNPESLVSAKCLIEQTLCQSTNDDKGQAQFAKDVDYATAVLDAWKEQEMDRPSRVVWKRHVVYYEDTSSSITNPTKLYGHLVARGDPNDDFALSPKVAMESSTVPGIVFFHTGAGPHDIFLLWKAATLVMESFGGDEDDVDDAGCVVFVADMLGDETGWAWDAEDRSRYNKARQHLLGTTADTEKEAQIRPVLRNRIQAAVDALLTYSPSSSSSTSTRPLVDATRWAAMGWCLGGHSIIELVRMNLPGVRAMATFHGVFDGLPNVPATELEAQEETDDDGSIKVECDKEEALSCCEVLLCHGTQDPFVSDVALERALATLQVQAHRGGRTYRTSLLQLVAKHGFTNPAQDFNDNPAFMFNQEAADKAWRQTLNLLHRTLDVAS